MLPPVFMFPCHHTYQKNKPVGLSLKTKSIKNDIRVIIKNSFRGGEGTIRA